jgi:hypothetical protein
MADRELQLEAKVAWLQYRPERMNLSGFILRERIAVWTEGGEEGARLMRTSPI